MRAEDLIGQTIDRYRMEAIIGTGGLTVVYRAVEIDPAGTAGPATATTGAAAPVVAVKVLFSPPGGAEVRARFQREAELVQRLDHPGIVPVLAVGEADGRAYLVMPLLSGGSLAERLRSAGRLDEVEVADLAWQVADALHYAHRQGIVHRDIKPSNILLAEDGVALLADFGVARALDDPKLTQTGLAVGTPFYMAPEQAAGERGLDGRADLYALGVVLFQAITGRIPFRGSTPQVLHAHVYDPPPPPSTLAQVSPAMEAIILQALAKDPAERFQSGADMAAALAAVEEALADEQTQTRLEIPIKPSRRWTWLAVLAVLAVIAGGWWGWRSGLLGLEPVVSPTPSLTRQPVEPIRAQSLSERGTATPADTATLRPTAVITAAVPVSPSATATMAATATMTTSVTAAVGLPGGSLLKGRGEGIFRVAMDGRLQHIFDWDTFSAFGFQEADIQTVADQLLATWSGEELTRVIEDQEGIAFWVVDGQRWQVNRWQEALRSLEPSVVDAALLAQLPLTQQVEDLPAGTLLSSDGQVSYVLLAGGVLRRLDSTLLVAYGYDQTAINQIPEPVLFNSGYQIGLPLTELLQPEGGERVFLIEDGRRREMPVGDPLWAMGYGVEDISQVPPSFVENFPLLVETESAVVETTPSPTAAACDHDPADFVASLWQSEPDLAAELGCPLAQATTVAAAWQPFEGGDMIWRQDSSLIYVLPQTGTIQITGDRWREGDAEFDPTISAPDRFYQPVRGFGLAWRELAGVREALGWAMAEEAGFEAQIQLFERGTVLGAVNSAEEGPAKWFILFNDNSFQVLDFSHF